MNELHIFVLYLVTFGLAFYGIRKDRQYQRERMLAELARQLLRAEAMNRAIKKYVAEAKGMTEEEFNKAWEAKWTRNK